MLENRLAQIKDFEQLTLSSQLEHLAQALDAHPAFDLIQLCAPIRDPAPLAWLSRQLLERGWLCDQSNQDWFANFLIGLPETAVDKLLKAMVAPLTGAETCDRRQSLCQMLLRALRVVPLKALSSMCLIDRTLKHHFPDERDSHLNLIFNEIETQIKAGQPESVPLSFLAQMTSTAVMKLEDTAALVNERCLSSFQSHRKHLAQEAIQILEDAPKAVSQANAEDLLARRVYTDPGHFLIELLQNAEDSGAKVWRVLCDRDKMVIWHDGIPFDTRDLVGITSIGQTTKRKQQIGFFGVGFKSVYEVTDRPQIYSDVYNFEIADVSIPKLLSQRPSYLPASGTAVVLPLRANLDDERSPVSLFEKGAALDSCVLLTLRSIEEIEFRLTEAAGGPLQHTLIECASESGTTIRHEPSGKIVDYLIQDDEYKYSGVAREAGRPDSTKVMVGILRDASGHPHPLPETAAEVYSYLPTREQPGLRFFLQGHFDVPVDRERIAPDSLWNRWIVSQVPHQLARIAQRISDDQNSTAAAGFINILPLKRDLPNAPFAQIPTALSSVLNSIEFVPVAINGRVERLVAPVNTIVAEPSIVSLFEDDQIGDDRFFLNSELSDRHREVLLELGATNFSTSSLITYLEKRLSDRSGRLPNFMQRPAKLEVLYDLLLTELELLERQGEKDLLNALLKRVKALPLVPDSNGELHASQNVVRGTEFIRRIYAGTHHFIDPRLETSNARTFAFFDKIGVDKLDLEYLVSDLETTLGNLTGPLELPRNSFPNDEDCLEKILEAFVSADWNVLQKVARLPLFRSANGKFYPMATNTQDEGGVLNASNPSAKDIANFYGTVRPIATPRPRKNEIGLEDQDGLKSVAKSPYEILLDRLPVPGLTLEVLSDDLQSELFKTDFDTLQRLHELLENHVEDISDKISKQLVRLPIWPDRNAKPGVLQGSNRIYIPADDSICEIFQRASFLDKVVLTRKHTLKMQIAAVAVNQVIEGLTFDAEPPLVIEHATEEVDRALRYIHEHASRVDSTGIKTLKDKAVFLNDGGKVRTLSTLSKAESAELRAIYGTSDLRNFVDENGSSWTLIRELGLENALTAANVELLADDIEADLATEQKLRDPQTGYRAILVYVSKRVDKMTRQLTLRYAKFPIYPDTTGSVGSLSNERADRSPDFVYPASGHTRKVFALTAVRLLNAEIENIIRPLIVAAKIPEAGLDILVDSLIEHPVTDEDALDLIQELFVDRKYELQQLFPHAERQAQSRTNRSFLNSLPIWKTLSGQCKGASEIMGGNLSELFEPGTAEYDELLKACVKPAALTRLKDLAPLMVAQEPESFLADLIKRTALPGKPLSAQPYFLSSIDRVLRLYEVAGTRSKVELPSIDAAGNLTFAKLFYTDSETLALLAGLPVLAQVLHADLTAYFDLLKDKQNQLSGIRNQMAKFWNKVISTHDASSFQKLPPEVVIAALPLNCDAERRIRFYRWLLSNKISIFEDKNCVAKLIETPLFQTKKGNLVRPTDLVFDDDMPDLGIDWLPGPDIPKPLIDTLKIHLDVGRLNLDDLIRRHVVPAYEAATESGEHVQAGILLTWLAKRLINRPESETRRLLKGKKSACILIEASDGSFHLPEKLLLPAPEIRAFVSELWEELPQPSELRYSEDVYPFLVSLGVSTTPNLDLVAEKLNSIATRNHSLALARIVYYAKQIYGEGLFKRIPTLRTAAWLSNGDGALKSPGELYVRAYEIETLIGPFADLYIDKTEEEILGPDLIKALGFKDITSVHKSEILNHLEYRAGRKEQISQRAYAWLDQSAGIGDLTAADYNRIFADKPSILTDDGEYELHTKVIGTRAFQLFGNLRGYWTRGWRSYPSLCKLLGITEGTTPQAVQNFVEEVGSEVKKNGSKDLLKREPALPLMLTSCFAILSRKGIIISRDLPVIPAVYKQNTELLPASTPGIYWSDTPTLETLFANVGKLYLARRSTTDDAEDVDAFYTSMGVLRLRDTYKVVGAKREGSDRSAEQAQQILSLRQVLRGLVGVIPRIQLERELNADTTWVYTKHLKTLSASGSIKAIEHLKVRYVLPGVGEVEVERPAAYDTFLGELLIDTKVLADPDLTGLSEGLLPAIIQGPAAETFVDLFEILLARRTQDDMSAYLNRRHFAEAHVAPSSVDRIAQRIGELLDYGLAEKLTKRFDVFDGRSVQKWREPALIKEIEGLATNDPNQVASQAVIKMLRSVGIDTDEKDLEALMQKLLLAPSISDCSEMLVSKTKEKIETREEFVIRPVDKNADNGAKSSAQLQPVKNTSAEVTDRSGSNAATARDGVKDFFGRLFSINQMNSKSKTPEEKNQNIVSITGAAKPENKKEEPVQLPPWLQNNYFSPNKTIPSQMWATHKNAQALESMEKKAYLSFSPGRLPSPYLYAVNTLGASFNAITQSWSFGRSAQKYFSTPGEPSGRIVSFSGQFFAGKSRLPLPLYSRLIGPVTVGNGTLKSITHDEIGAVIEIEGRGVISVKYDVETQIVPQFTEDNATLAPPDKVLLTPTVPLHTLPRKVVEWINQSNSAHLSDSKRALAAQDFIRSNYQYDGGFLDREDVKSTRATLTFFTGNHHLELLHASGDIDVLGRGVCYELNVLLVELLRHLKIPSLIATGWVLDEGVVDLPDHLFALALLNSEEGPCLLPLDAAATERGPIRTVQRRSFPTPAKDLTSRPAIPTVKGTWNINPKSPARATEGGVPPHLDYAGPHSTKKKSASAPTPKQPNKTENSLSWLFDPFKENKGSETPSDKQKTISKSLSDARIAQEQAARKNLVEALEKERLMRQRAEAQLGEERRLRKILESQIPQKNADLKSSEDEVALAESVNDLDFRVTEPRRQAEEFNLLCKAYDLTIDALGLEANAYPMGSEAVRQKLIKLLGSTATLETFLRVLRGEQTHADTLTSELKFLEDLRLIELETVPTVLIHVIDGEEET